MRSESHSTGDQRSAPAPFWRGGPGGGKRKKRSGGRANERVDGIPDGVHEGDFVCEKFQQIECDGRSQNPGMRETFEPRRQVDHTKTLEQAQSRDRGVKVEAGREPGAQGETEGFDGIHVGPS